MPPAPPGSGAPNSKGQDGNDGKAYIVLTHALCVVESERNPNCSRSSQLEKGYTNIETLETAIHENLDTVFDFRLWEGKDSIDGAPKAEIPQEIMNQAATMLRQKIKDELINDMAWFEENLKSKLDPETGEVGKKTMYDLRNLVDEYKKKTQEKMDLEAEKARNDLARKTLIAYREMKKGIDRQKTQAMEEITTMKTQIMGELQAEKKTMMIQMKEELKNSMQFFQADVASMMADMSITKEQNVQTANTTRSISLKQGDNGSEEDDIYHTLIHQVIAIKEELSGVHATHDAMLSQITDIIVSFSTGSLNAPITNLLSALLDRICTVEQELLDSKRHRTKLLGELMSSVKTDSAEEHEADGTIEKNKGLVQKQRDSPLQLSGRAGTRIRGSSKSTSRLGAPRTKNLFSQTTRDRLHPRELDLLLEATNGGNELRNRSVLNTLFNSQ
ncbi:hypothetical protein B0J11DRAFT_503888 [Dendryphion nanum]|uniref:Uncharacterized protein n=1 Tax=Dendryphion nanum TaxID=256645 RepID=A0A9P9IR41_9PLEO|nr:hypothetical protein B0J11DRAFT_503888 [Dendryphion nanum]